MLARQPGKKQGTRRGRQSTYGTRQGCVQQEVIRPRLERRDIDRGDDVTHMKIDDIFNFVGGPIEETPVAQHLATAGVILHLRPASPRNAFRECGV